MRFLRKYRNSLFAVGLLFCTIIFIQMQKSIFVLSDVRITFVLFALAYFSMYYFAIRSIIKKDDGLAYFAIFMQSLSWAIGDIVIQILGGRVTAFRINLDSSWKYIWICVLFLGVMAAWQFSKPLLRRIKEGKNEQQEQRDAVSGGIGASVFGGIVVFFLQLVKDSENLEAFTLLLAIMALVVFCTLQSVSIAFLRYAVMQMKEN